MTASKTNKKFSFRCNECNGEAHSNRRDAEFCGDRCRKVYNNRRAVRGAELYDLVMKMRFERADAKDDHIWSHICSLAGAYREADKSFRDGRKSWDSKAQDRLPISYGRGGDQR